MLRLVAYAHDGVQRFPIHRPQTLIGSQPECDVYLPYTGVAQRHARLDWAGDELRIEDLGTRRGVLVNGERVRAATLQVLDEVRLGAITLLVEDVGAPVEEPPPPASPAVAARPRLDPVGMMQHVAAMSDWVLADAESRATVESLLTAMLADLAGGALFLLQLEGDAPTLKLVVATDAAWLACGEELLEQAHRARPQARTEAGELEGLLGGARAWIFYRFFLALERPNLVIVALPRFDPAGWSPRPALHAVADLLVLGLVHHVGHFEPLLPGRDAGGHELQLAPGLVVGQSPEMQSLFTRLRGAVDPPVHLLLRGEPGVGKELLARSLHMSGPRRAGPFIAATCAGAGAAQLEADLFGAEVAGQAGTIERRGKLALADGGTLLLDEIERLPLALQARLVRVLRAGEVEPAGSLRVERTDVRVIAAAREPLEPLVARGEFRVDLAYTLSRLAFDVPPLRRRLEDLPLLIQSCVNRFCHEAGKRVQGITVDAMSALLSYDYPGNLPELENLLRQLVYLCPPGQPIRLNLLPERLRSARLRAAAPVDSSSDLGLERLVASCEAAAIREALRRSRGNKAEASRLLGLSRNGLAMKMERHHLKS